MAIRARSDNLSLDIPTGVDAAAAPASLSDFTEVWAQREALRQACVRMIGDPARAEDLVQDTFMSALKYRGRLHEGQPVAPWLKTVARRRSIDELRGRDRVALVAEPPEPIGLAVEDPADHVVSQELVGQLRQAIAELSVRERQLLLRQASYGLSLAELAAEEDTSIASVRSVLARARQKLRLSLERGGVFGALPLPRYLSTLRERLFRWGSQLEPALPAVTGAGARFSEAVAAVITAIALFVAGTGLPDASDSSVASVALASASDHGGPPSATSPPRADDNRGAHGRGRANGSSSTEPSPPTGSGVPITVPPGPLADDGTTLPEETTYTRLTASQTGGHVFALGGSASGEHVVYRSTDSGTTWKRLLADGYLLDGPVLLPPDYPTKPTMFIASPHGLLRSDDMGDHFRLVVPGRGYALLSPDYASGDRRIIMPGTPLLEYWADRNTVTAKPSTATAGLYKPVFSDTFSTDRALLWNGNVPRDDNPMETTPVVYRCTPTQCAAPALIPNDNTLTTLFKSATGLVVAWYPSELFISHDDGASFSPVALPPGFKISSVADGAPGQLLVTGINHQGTTSGLIATDDAGASWTTLGAGTALEAANAVVRLPNGSLIAAPSRVMGLLCSLDGGATWAPRC